MSLSRSLSTISNAAVFPIRFPDLRNSIPCMRLCRRRFLATWQHATVVLSDKRNHDKSQRADRISGFDGEVKTMLLCVRRRPKPVDKDARPCLTGQFSSSSATTTAAAAAATDAPEPPATGRMAVSFIFHH